MTPRDPSTGPDDLTLATIAAGTTSAAGEAFFAALVQRLAEAMGMCGAWVTEWQPEARRLRALSFWFRDRYWGDYEYDVAGTPCEPVVHDRRLCHVPDRVVELFPGDRSLVELDAVSYLGVPLEDVDGALLGHLALLHDAPLPESPRLATILNIFAGRAAAELQRLRRDRKLEEQKLKLTRLFDNTLDAILELDGELRVTQMNRAAKRIWGQSLIGSHFERRLTAASAIRFRHTLGELARAPEPASTWLVEGLDCLDDHGEPFPAEATVSCFEDGGVVLHTLILRNVLERVLAQERIEALTVEARSLREELETIHGDAEIVGSCPAMRRLLFDVGQVAATEAAVLITGETGTGKELVARALHRASNRAEAPMVKVNCAAIAASLQESEFFGHEKGAFTGATQRREGRFERAHGGTLFLDEVGELPLDLQAKLLRALQEGEFEPVGGTRTVKVDVRVIAATNRDLRQMVDAGTFREDLYYRLNVFPLDLPPLRERGDDVLTIAEALLRSMAERKGYRHARLTPEDRARILRYDWPGNVRELQNVLERALITSRGGQLELERVLPDGAPRRSREAPHERDPAKILTAVELADLERENVRRALEATGWKISGAGGAAELLGLKPNTLSSRIKALGLTRSRR
jgi:PAS domain S-box-containing protein